MNFADVNNIAIPEGRVRRIIMGNECVWAWNRTAETDIYPLAVNNYWISSTGVISGNDTNWISTDKIPVTDRASVRFGLLGHGSIGTVVAYDKNGAVLGCAKDTTQRFFEGVYDVPQGTTHITVTGCTETYRPTEFANQYAVLTDLAYAPPRYVEDSLILWCDGVNNTGNGHSNAVTTWKDLSGNGNDIINAESKTSDRSDYDNLITPADEVKGEWRENGIAVNAINRQMLRTPNLFDLGADYTLEMRVSQLVSDYMTIGFNVGTRFKLRIENTAWWVRVSASDTNGQNINPGKTMAPIGTPVTYTVSHSYHADTNQTVYRVYANGLYLTRASYAGVHREGDSAYIAIGMENDNLIVHSVRLYSRALTDAEIETNNEYDTLRLGG